MKCHTNSSADTSMSFGNCSCRLRFLALVVTTGDLINERATGSLGITHALVAPVTIFTTYFFFIVFIINDCRQGYASRFLQIYAIISCVLLQISLSMVVFQELKNITAHHRDTGNTAYVLNGVLPMFTILILLSDLVITIFSKRHTPPSRPPTPTHPLSDTSISQLSIDQTPSPASPIV